jgi:uncharacterized damage-inducible protein DinB
MISPSHPQMMASYNGWMNERLFALCATLSDGDRKRDVGAFFRSIHGTLNHILLGDRLWLGRFLGRPFVVDSLDQELYSEFVELRAERESTDREIGVWAKSLTPEQLADSLTYVSFTNPAKRMYPLWVTVVHFFNHQAHHRGQLTTLLCQLGLDPGVTDVIWLPELAATEMI